MKITVLLIVFVLFCDCGVASASPIDDAMLFTKSAMRTNISSKPHIIVDNDLILKMSSNKKLFGRPKALFLNGTIVLQKEPENLYDYSLIVHEMVHYIQKMNGSTLCENHKEYQAYSIQNQFLLANGSNSIIGSNILKRFKECS